MKVVTWNVNSLRVRLGRVTTFLQREKPDVVCLQELKCMEEQFPFAEFSALGYHAAVFGQKTYNGVAILSRTEATDSVRGLSDDVADPQARLIAATVSGVRVVSAYIPNGSELGSDKFSYKMQWLSRLLDYLKKNANPEQPLLICGDFNIAPEEKDVHDPARWKDTVLFHDSVRQVLKTFYDWGLKDVFRHLHDEAGLYSWWDYRDLAFPRDHGLRIDFILATQSLAKKCGIARMERGERSGEKPSDHIPVIAEFQL